MLIAPYNTDAPLYHLPIGTVAIIVINSVIYFCTMFQVLLGNTEVESLRWLMLDFSMINPLQWLTACFMHGDPIHLIGNMIFLWSFGLVVEGKIGTPRFLLIYLIMSLLWGAGVQLPMFVLGSDEFALGASGVIFGLLVIAVIWAPENEMDCFFWIFLYGGTFEVRLVTLGVFYIFMQLIFLWLGGFSMSSEMLHLIGMMIGAPIGFYMLRMDKVDCEGWDIVSRNEWMQEYDFFCSEKQRQRLKKKKKSIEDPVTAALGYTQPIPVKEETGPKAYIDRDQDESLPEPQTAQPQTAQPQTAEPEKPRSAFARLTDMFEPERVKRQRAEQSRTPERPAVNSHPDFNRLSFAFRQAVEMQSTATALQTFQQMDQLKIAVGLGDKTLLQYAKLLGREKKFLEAMRPLAIIAGHNAELADDARLRIAQIQLSVLRRPVDAVHTLNQIADNHSTHAAQQRTQIKAKLLASAHQAMQG